MNEKFFRKGPLNAAKNRPSLPSEAELAGVPAADERKTVILDEDLDGVEFEDRVWLYWKRNRNFIVFTITAACAIVIGVQAWKMYRANASESRRRILRGFLSRRARQVRSRQFRHDARGGRPSSKCRRRV